MLLTLRPGSDTVDAIVRTIGSTSRAMTRSMNRLSSGKLDMAATDPARAALALQLDTEAGSMRAARRNALQGAAMVQVAEGATANVSDILKRVRSLAVQASTETLTDDERAFIDTERTALVDEIDRIAGDTMYGQTSLTDGSQATRTIRVGIRGTTDDAIELELGDLRAATLGVDSVDLSTAGSANAAIGLVDTALETTNRYRSTYGAVTNRLESASRYLQSATIATESARSRVEDVDIAAETANMARLSIQQQTATAALAQSSRLERGAAMRLLGG
jgi:flagellin